MSIRQPISERFLFPVYDRDSYRATFGVQAPPFDASRPVKRWADHTPRADDETVEYTIFDWSRREFTKLHLTGRVAKTYNIPGPYQWPQYKPEPTPAVIAGPNGDAQPLNPLTLTTFEQAVELGREIARMTGFEFDAETGVIEPQFAPGSPFVLEWRGEKRRQYEIILKARGREVHHNAGLLLAEKYRNGVGRPGFWQVDAGNPDVLVWVTLYQPEYPLPGSQEIPVPVEPLGENERLEITPFTAYVVRIEDDDFIAQAVAYLEKALEALSKIKK